MHCCRGISNADTFNTSFHIVCNGKYDPKIALVTNKMIPQRSDSLTGDLQGVYGENVVKMAIEGFFCSFMHLVWTVYPPYLTLALTSSQSGARLFHIHYNIYSVYEHQSICAINTTDSIWRNPILVLNSLKPSDAFISSLTMLAQTRRQAIIWTNAGLLVIGP